MGSVRESRVHMVINPENLQLIFINGLTEEQAAPTG